MADVESMSHWEEIATALITASSKVVRKTVFDMQSDYVANAPRDTGFMVNSAYVITNEENTYSSGGGADILKMNGMTDASEDVASDPDGTTAVFAVGAEYALFVELGTRYMNAQPAFYPAVESARADFDLAMELINQAWEDLSLE